MLRRERHKLLLLAKDPAGLATGPERHKPMKMLKTFNVSFGVAANTLRRTDVINVSQFNLYTITM
jgi:hypothetical protein